LNLPVGSQWGPNASAVRQEYLDAVQVARGGIPMAPAPVRRRVKEGKDRKDEEEDEGERIRRLIMPHLTQIY